MSPMGKDKEDDRRNTSIHADFDYLDTQPFDTSSCGEDDVYEWRYFEDTEPFDDDDALENRAVNVAGETQVLEVGGETQVLEIAGETQALDDNEDTQLLDEEGLESDGTQVLENVDDDEVSVDDPQCRDSAQSNKVLDERVTAPVTASQTSSCSMPPRFTFLRAESLREAALANRNIALKQTQDETKSVMEMSQFGQEPLVVKGNGESFSKCSEKDREVDQEYNHGKHNMEIEGFESKNMDKVASLAVRKLFNDLPVETNGPSLSSNDFNEGDGLDKPIYHGELAGLSYVNSQDPGELSQVNALDFVDRFLKDNISEFDQETNRVKNVEEKSRSLPSTKGKQNLAKRVNDRSRAGKAGIYEWDDSREDEGGGDIFRRRKEDFFEGETHRPRSLPGFRKIKAHRPNDDKDDDEQLSLPNKRKTTVHSDSRLGMHNLKVRDNTIQEATKKLERNLANELDEQFYTNCSRGEMEPNANADAQEMLGVGLDTQMAAEAMEALCNAGNVDPVANDATRVTRSRSTGRMKNSSIGKVGSITSKERSRQCDKKRKVNVKSDLLTSGLSKKCTKEVRQCKEDNMMSRSKKSKLNAEGNRISSANENGRIVAEALRRHQLDELNNPDINDGGNGGSLVNEKQFQGEVCQFTPVARRTRQSLAANQLINCDIPSKSLRGEIGLGSAEKSSGIGLQASKALDSKSTPGSSDHCEVDDNTNLCQLEKLAPKSNAVSASNDVETDAFDCPKRRRSLRINKLSNHDKGSEKFVGSSKSTPGSSDHCDVDDNTNLCQLEKLAPKTNAVSASNDVETDAFDCRKRRRSLRINKLSNHDEGSEKFVGSSKPSAQAEDTGKSTAGKRKMRTVSVVKSHVTRQIDSSSYGGSVILSTDKKRGKILDPNLDKANRGDIPIRCDVMDEKDANLNSDVKNNADVLLSTNDFEVTSSDESPGDRYKSSDLATATPVNCKTPVNDASPVCMGDDYYKQSCNRNLSRSCLLKVFRTELHRELRSLSAIRPELVTPSKDSRKRKDMTDVRILYSHHLDGDIIKHQKKILARLGVSVVSSIADATHFIADQFVRTRNMLEAIAFGKPVVTHLWIESCGQASCFIDERNYILRDAKKEKEFGFSMPVSLAHASQHPLLEGRRVLITPNTKPSKEIISSLVMAVQGQAVERVGRSALKDHKIPDDLLILSCEEDYAPCVPFLEKGAMVYSSELLLNGIVTQKLEYQRHRLFADNVKKTRSTIWLKRDDRTFIPVTKCK